MKRCIICGESRPIGEYYAHPQMADGHVNKCKDCYKKCVRDNRLRRLEYYIAYDRSRGSDRNRRRPPRYGYRPHPEHSTTRRKLRYAVAKGRIERPTTCEKCGREPGKDPGAGRYIEAHHRDYNKPFDVLWLCRSCHRREHAEGPDPIPLRTEHPPGGCVSGT